MTKKQLKTRVTQVVLCIGTAYIATELAYGAFRSYKCNMLSHPHEQNPAEYKKGGFDEVDVDLADRQNKQALSKRLLWRILKFFE